MEQKQSNNLMINNPSHSNPTLERKGILLDNLSILHKIENIFIIDFYHINSEKNDKTDLDIIKFYEIIKENSVYDENMLYLFLHSNKQLELIENIKAINNISAKNIFIEDKIANVSLITGFCLAKNISILLFTDGINQLGSWTRIKDPAYEKIIKISELDYFRITLDSMLKNKKRKYEQDIIKANKTKLSKILEVSNNNKEAEVKPTLKNILSQQPPNANLKINNSTKEKYDFINKKRVNSNISNSNQNTNNSNINKNSNNTTKNNNDIAYKTNEKTRKNEIEEYLCSYKFINFLNKIRKYIQTNPPKNFEVLKNIIYHFTEQNIISINNNLKEINTSSSNESVKPEELSFYIFKELLKKEFILSKKFYDIVDSNIVSTLDEISNLLNFQINLNNNSINALEEEIKNYNSENNNNQKLIQVNSNGNSDKNKFSIGDNSEEEYKNLILNCQSVCLFVKNVIFKILNTINLSSIEKLPTNPARYKNYIFAFVNNQELYKISKKILNMDYNNIVNVITDGIVLEFMKNNLIVFISDKKIHYNLPDIEKEKFRLFKSKNVENANVDYKLEIKEEEQIKENI